MFKQLARDFGDYSKETMSQYQHTSLGGVVSTANAAIAIASDPYLPMVVDLVLELEELESGDDARDSGSTGTGVGLRNIAGPLRTYVNLQKKPWVLPLTVVGVFGLVFAVGYYTRAFSRPQIRKLMNK